MSDYVVAVDRDGDFYAHLWSVAGGENNLHPNAVDWTVSAFHNGMSNVGAYRGYTPYGVWIFNGLRDGSSWGKLQIRCPSLGNGKFWCGFYARAPYGVIGNWYLIVREGSTSRGSSSVALTTDWQFFARSATFSLGQSINLELYGTSGTTGGEVEMTGPWLSSGFPGVFNAGSGYMDDQITDDVVRVKWWRGFDQPRDPIAARTTGEVVIRNDDGAYSPGGAKALEIGQVLAVGYDQNPGVELLGHFRIESVLVDNADEEGKRLRVTLGDVTRIWYVAPYLRELGQDVTLFDLLNGAQDGGTFAPPAPFFHSFQYFYDPDVSVSAYPGATWFGDQMDDGRVFGQALRELAFMLRGRAWADKWGRMRNYAYANSLSKDADLSGYFEVDREYGTNLINYVRFEVMVRETSSNVVLYDNWTTEWEIPAQLGTWVFWARLRDNDYRVAGATSINTPSPGNNIWWHTSRSGGGFNYTGTPGIFSPTFELVGSSVKVTLQRLSTVGSRLFVRVQIVGSAVLSGPPSSVIEQDDASIQEYGIWPLIVWGVALDDLGDAQDAAKSIVTNYKTPRGAVRYVTLDQRNRAEILAREIFDYMDIYIGDTWSHDAYIIISEAHDIDLGSDRHVVRYGIEEWNNPS